MVGPTLWTYSGDPNLSALDQVRFLVQDTDPADKRIGDAEILWIITQEPTPYYAAAAILRSLAASFARKVNTKVGDLSINYGDIAKNYRDMASEMAAKAAVMGTVPYAGGISRTDKELVAQNTDRVRPVFRQKQFDNPSGPNNTTDDGWGDGFGDGS